MRDHRHPALALLAAVVLLGSGCGSAGTSARDVERYVSAAAGVERVHCVSGRAGWSYVCRIRHGKRVYRVAALVRGKHVVATSRLLRARGPLPPVPGSPAAVLARASEICSRRRTLVAAIPKPQNPYAAYRLMGAYAAAEREEAESFRLLSIPAARKEEMRRLISAADRVSAAAEAYRHALLRHDRRAQRRALVAGNREAAEEARAAAALGLDCIAVKP